jgi:MFS family permease
MLLRMPPVSPSALAIIATVAVANFGNNIVAPIVPSIRAEFGASAVQVGMVVSGFAFGRLAMDLPAGYLADRISVTRMFTLGILISAAAACLAWASSDLQQLVIFRTLMGFGSAIMSTVALVMLTSITPSDQRGTVLAYYTSALLMGQAIAPAVGGYLANVFHWRAAFLFCAFTPLVSLPLTAVVASKLDGIRGAHRSHRSSRHEGPSAGVGLSADQADWRALAAVYFTTFVNFLNRQGMRQTVLPLYGGLVLAMDPGAIGTVLTLCAVTTIVLTLPAGAVADRVGRKTLLIPGLAFLVLGNLMIIPMGSAYFFYASVLFVSMGVVANSMQSGLVADLLPERLVGKGMGVYRFSGDLGMVVGPVVLGTLLDIADFRVAVSAGAVAVLAGILAALLFVPHGIRALASHEANS